MELVQDLLFTASVALILSFLVAKLVAVAIAGREPEAEFGESEIASGQSVFMEEVRFDSFEEKLRVEEAFRDERRFEFVGEVNKVDQFEVKPVRPVEEVEEPLQHHHQEGRELKEEESVAAGLPEKSSDGEEKVSVEKGSEFDSQRGDHAQQSSEKRGVEEIGAESAANDVVKAQIEQVRVVDCNEPKVNTHVAKEVKWDNFSDEDDWEGIEKSELDDDYTGAEKYEGK